VIAACADVRMQWEERGVGCDWKSKSITSFQICFEAFNCDSSAFQKKYKRELHNFIPARLHILVGLLILHLVAFGCVTSLRLRDGQASRICFLRNLSTHHAALHAECTGRIPSRVV
jgi:hypothetical protein